MSRKAIIWLAFGLGLGIGLLAAKLGADAIKGAQASGRIARTVSVVRAAQDIDAYQEILTEQVEAVETNDNLLAPEHDRIANARDVVGRVAAKAVPKGSPVLRSMLTPKGTRPRGIDRLSADLRSLSGNSAATLGDVDGNGYVDLVDYDWFEICFSYSGPNVTPFIPGCLDIFDFDTDGDVDLADFGAFERAKGHLPMPLRDTLGNVITIDSTKPYSPRQTCGTVGCHYIEDIANGEWFQQGRTDLAGNVDMHDDYFGDGRYWIKSAGRYGKWGQSFQFMLAAKDNTHASQIDQTNFAWVRDCSGCHSGGGQGEFDRDDQLLYNEVTGEFGYELLGKTPEDVEFDGDYSVLDSSTGTVSPGAWDVTGLSEPDCLLCHRDNRPTVGGVDMVMGWRKGILAAGTSLVDDQGDPVPAYAAAATAGQGWFAGGVIATTPVPPQHDGSLTPADIALLEGWDSSFEMRAPRSTLQIDYSVGVANGSLLVNENNEVLLAPNSVALRTRDWACVSCHPLAVVAGEVWFDDRDVMYAGFNNLRDDDPTNDIPPERSTACTECHPTALDHNAAKGNAFQLQYRNELDYENFRSCRECHLTVLSNGDPNPLKHPNAPDVPGEDPIHAIGFYEGDDGPMRIMSCQACHIPYALTSGLLFRDITMPGSIGWTSQYLSADPLNPSDEDKSRWYPPLRWKVDSDGVERLFPASVWINIYFGDWDQNGTPEDLSDDVIAPIYTWRVAQVVGDLPQPVDDDGDGRPELNHPKEIYTYLQALKQNDSNGVPVATNPVLVKGPKVWYEDLTQQGGVNSFEHEGTGIPITSYPYIWGMDHNVLAKEESWGTGDEPDSCDVCHRGDGLSPVFDRKVLIDPHDVYGQPIYKTVRELTEVNPYHSRVTLKDNLGNPITVDSTRPYSGRQTCGGVGCHDVDHISNGAWFQDGRTDVNGDLDMRDDYCGDGRFWIKSAGRYGKWGQSFQYLLAAKENTNASQMDQTTFAWVRDCSGCHPGAGPGEFDRDGQLLYDEATGEFGYEALGLTQEDVELDGDYSVLDYSTGSVSRAEWEVTNLSGPDCLKCHRTERTIIDGVDMNLVWRMNVLAAGPSLVDNAGEPVPAFAAAGTAGQGWFSTLERSASPGAFELDGSMTAADALFLEAGQPGATMRAAATTLQIDYSVGVVDGSLIAHDDGTLAVAPASMTWPPKDQACWACHPYGTIAGTVWFDEQDIHYRKFNNLNDDDPDNDIPVEESRVCVVCHPGTLDHDIGKGNSPQLQYRNERDWGSGFRTCRNCHLTTLPDGQPNPLKHADAPDVPGDDEAHAIDGMMDNLSCQACHIPYPLTSSVLFRDITVPGSVGTSGQYYSADPLDPTDPDKSRWYPGFVKKEDVDGVERWFPANIWITIYFGDWDQNGTPEDLTDDVISPIYTWHLAQAVGSPTEPLPIVTDDDGDGRKEINRPEELLAYFEALQGNDANGEQIAANPVLVRGKRFWYADPQEPEGVGSFEHEGTGIAMEKWYPYIWGLDHNVLVGEESWGYDDLFDPEDGCNHCHRYDGRSPVFDRKILVDPCDPDGQAIYETTREMMDLNPP